MEEKKYVGRGGWRGGGRPKKADHEKKVYKTISLSGSPEEIELLKEKAAQSGKTVSRYVLDSLIGE